MNGRRGSERTDRLRAIPLEWVLRLFGAQADRYDPCKWHTSGGVLSIKGTKFMDWKSAKGGGGAIDLVMHLRKVGFTQALQWLEHHFPSVIALPASIPTPSLPLLLPPPHPESLPSIQYYLTQERRLPLDLVQEVIQSGDVYADAKANAVFLLRDSHGRSVGAELRGTTAVSWRGMAPGSRKNEGYFSIPLNPRDSLPIILCESAIDALSCFTLHPGYRCISTAGARPNPRWLSQLVQSGNTIYCGFDADATGEAMARSMISLHPSILPLRPRFHDWNDNLRSLSR